jgi:nucleoid-associated protein YgaU
MKVNTPYRGPFRERRSALCFGFLFFFLFPSITRAQDVAEAARQERARKAVQPQTHRHVYTGQELQRKKILTPEDQATVEARRNQPSKPSAEQTAQSLPTGASPRTESLGEVARRYRQKKGASAAEQSAKRNFTPFSYEIPGGTFAAPKSAGTPIRISPFQPRPLVVVPHALRDSPIVRNSPTAPLAFERRAPPNRLPGPERVGLQPLQVQRGESWWKLAERFLGNGARWPELRRLNAGLNGPPELLVAGSTVQVPENGSVAKRPSGRTITVKNGDSLWTLARKHLGHGTEWIRLAHANPQISDYTRLAIGTKLQLPAAEALVSSRGRSSGKLQQ